MVEYNVAVRNVEGMPRASAIEQPKSAEELLDFRAKYLSSGNKKTGGKLLGTSSEGMLSLTRTINPELRPELSAKIRAWALTCFSAVGGSGAPRIDFISDGRTGELWLNEVNPCPGSFGFFLWEAAEEPILFTELLTSLIDEAIRLHRTAQLPQDPTQAEARLFKHP
jgi:D-alanine-D-alanine ligase